VPSLSDVVEIFSVGGEISMLSAFVAEPPLVSATRTVKFESPAD
jgi:hypothetical protein